MHFDDVALDNSKTPSDTAGPSHTLIEPRSADYSNLRGELQAESEPSHQPDDHLAAAGSNLLSGSPSSPYQMRLASPGATAKHQAAVAPHAAAEATAAPDEETMHIKDLDSGREYTLDKVCAS